MNEYVCIFATGSMVREVSKKMREDGIIVRADLVESFPVKLKNGKAKLGSNSDLILMVAAKNRMAEAVGMLKDKMRYADGDLFFYAIPVIDTSGID